VDPKARQKQIERHLEALKRVKSREERRLINENARVRKEGQGRRPPRRRDWSDWDEDEATDEDLFETMRPASPTDLSAARRPVRTDLADLVSRGQGLDRGLLVAPRGSRATVLAGGVEIEVEVPAELRPSGTLVVGDEVHLEAKAPEVMRIVGRAERRSVLARRDPASPRLEKVIAANVDVGVIVLPVGGRRLKTGLVDRLWIALARGGIEGLVALNKVDLAQDGPGHAAVERALESWRTAGLEGIATSAVAGIGIDSLRAALAGRTAVFVGQSGAGKSSLLNLLDPAGERMVKQIRATDGRGRHATTASTLRELEDGTRLIDTPGVRAFGLPLLEPGDVLAAYPEIEVLAGDCRFRDCAHDGEQGCAVEAAAARDSGLAARFDGYRRIAASLREQA